MPDLAVVILNYRTPDLTLACLASLEPQLDEHTRVIVVDNASGDGSADRIEHEIIARGLHAEVLRSPINGGFAAGMNYGINAAHADGYILLNSDTIMRPDALAQLREAMRSHPDAGVVGPALIDEHGETAANCFRDPKPLSELVRAAQTGVLGKLLRSFELVFPTASEPVEPDWIAFACVLVRREVIERIGALDDGYFMYFEDVDYCRRAREAGFRILYWPAAQVMHFGGASSGVATGKRGRKRAPRYYYEARARYYAKHFGHAGLLLANGFWCLGRGVAWSREQIERREPHHREREAIDIWTNAFAPLKESS
jgi:N-acetylglucosaminyl-diphospho-decaprenol L-rhamnosyltransferase